MSIKFVIGGNVLGVNTPNAEPAMALLPFTRVLDVVNTLADVTSNTPMPVIELEGLNVTAVKPDITLALAFVKVLDAVNAEAQVTSKTPIPLKPPTPGYLPK